MLTDCSGQKSVIDQIELAYSKWNPLTPDSPFRTYLYNSVPEEQVNFFGPSVLDDGAKWEEALEKRPTRGSIPVLCRGFEELGMRMRQQIISLQTLRGRLQEINSGLSTLMQKHDLEISVRAVECRRRHQKLAKQCLQLAAKTQVLRNRGFAMDAAEEALRQKLLILEKGVSDPALNGRSEEIWARMVSVRERSRLLQRELERSGAASAQEGGIGMDEEVMKRAKKVGAVCTLVIPLANRCADPRRLQLSAVAFVKGNGGYTEGLGGMGRGGQKRMTEQCVDSVFCTSRPSRSTRLLVHVFPLLAT